MNKKILKTKKQKYYTLDKILSQHAEYNLIYGQKSNGKSYAVKAYTLTEAYNNNYYTVICRRLETEVKRNYISEYFADMSAFIFDLTDGKYNSITRISDKLFFTFLDENLQIVERGPLYGRSIWMSGDYHFASQAFPGYTNFVFEEFFTDKIYLDNEPYRLMKLISTIARLHTMTVFLIGNTVSKLCPYIQEWGLLNIKKQKINTIDTYVKHMTDADGVPYDITIAVEYCEAVTTNRMVFGKASEMINQGRWESRSYPHLDKPYEDYDIVYEIIVERLGMGYKCQVLHHSIDDELLLYIYPHKYDIYKDRGTRRVTDIESLDPLTTRHLTRLCQGDIIILDLLERYKDRYSDDLTGTEFNQIISQGLIHSKLGGRR